MLLSDLLHSCANECVAEAAVASLGGAVSQTVRSEAEEHGVSVGFLVSCRVRGFARHAGEREWRELVDAVRGQDLPMLQGLRVILTKMLHHGVLDGDTRDKVVFAGGKRPSTSSLQL